MEDHKPKLYARLRVKTGEYESDGKVKSRYSDIGVLFASPHFNNMYINIDTLPINKEWDGRIFVNPIEENRTIQVEDFKDDKQLTHDFNKKLTQDVILEDIDDKPINLSEIPF
jgi:hypothetical protein